MIVCMYVCMYVCVCVYSLLPFDFIYFNYRSYVQIRHLHNVSKTKNMILFKDLPCYPIPLLIRLFIYQKSKIVLSSRKTRCLLCLEKQTRIGLYVCK